MCLSPHAGFNGVFRISKVFFVSELFEFEVGKISKFFHLGGVPPHASNISDLLYLDNATAVAYVKKRRF